jgi:hypothetical protein
VLMETKRGSFLDDEAQIARLRCFNARGAECLVNEA